MDKRRLGRGEVEVPRIVLGCGNFGGIGSAPEFFGAGESREEAFAVMDAAWELGITAFDTADAYGGGSSEAWIGEWIRTTGRRPVIVTKTFNPMEAGADQGLAPARLERQLASSLERLGVDTIDVYLAHAYDPETPVAETVAAFEALCERGLIRVYGVSNFDARQLEETLARGRPAAIENSYSLLERDDEAEVMPLARAGGVSYVAFGPLAGGWLAGRYRAGEEPPQGSRMATRPEAYEHLRTEQTFRGLEALAEAAADRGVSTAGLALAWVLAQRDVAAAIVGPRRPEHLRAVTEALELELSVEEAAALADLFYGESRSMTHAPPSPLR
jgi:aryl-alcohol dehydrogenase-like predicted oxidoreductase